MSEIKRVLFLDYVRACCMIWIVGFWHFSEYCRLKLTDKLWASNITIGVLGTFVFLSAFLLGKRKVKSKADIIGFYKRRLLRIYPMFFVSCVSFYILHLVRNNINYISDFKQLIYTLFGVSCFITPAPYTIWFISMLIFLYAITPFINMIANEKTKALVLLGLAAIVIISLVLGADIDNRLAYLVPMYFLGLFLSNKGIFAGNGIAIYLAAFCGGTIVFCICSFTQLSDVNYMVRNIMVAMSLTTTLLSLFKVLENAISHIPPLDKTLNIISYSSFCVYLFHRQIFGVIALLIYPFPLALGYIVILPCTILIMYAVQKIYDQITAPKLKPNTKASAS